MIIPLYPEQGDGSNATRIQGDAVSPVPPADRQVLAWSEATQQYVPSASSGGTLGATLLCTVTPIDQGSFLFPDVTSAPLAFDSFTGSGIGYNAATGEFTAQYNCVLAIQLSLSITTYGLTPVIQYIDTTVFLNGVQVMAYINGVGGGTGYISQTGILFMPVVVGDVFYLNSFVGATPDGGVMNSADYLNYIKIFKL